MQWCSAIVIFGVQLGAFAAEVFSYIEVAFSACEVEGCLAGGVEGVDISGLGTEEIS